MTAAATSVTPVTPLSSADGAELLDEVESFLARFVVYPSENARVAHALWIAHTWFMDQWDSTPRIAFLSPEPGSGKSRALEVMEHLVPRPVHCVNVSPAYLFRRVASEDGAPTLLYDEVDTVFGPKAKDNEEIRGMLNAGHRRGATAGRCERRGDQIITLDYPAYCAVALAGLDDLPDTIMTRSVVIRMRRRAPTEQVQPWRARLNAPEAQALGEKLMAWSNHRQHSIRWPEMPDGIEDRNADVWEALIAVADLAGGDWPERARVSAVSLVTSARQANGSMGVKLLRDLRRIFGDEDRLSTDTILNRLIGLEDGPWADLRGKPLDARGLAQRLGRYSDSEHKVGPRVMRDGSVTVRGYLRSDLVDAWRRYLPPDHPSAQMSDVTSETHVTNPPVQPVGPTCTLCGSPLDGASRFMNAETCTTCELN